METEINLQSAIVKVYGQQIYKCVEQNCQLFYQFTAYDHILTGSRRYFHLLVNATQYHISQGIYENNLNKFKKFIHHVEIILVDRNFHKCTYLLKSNINLIPMHKLLTLKKKCRQLIDSQTVLKIIKFMLETHNNKQIYKSLKLTLDKIAFTTKKQIKLCDYTLYFRKDTIQNYISKSFKNQLTQNIYNMLTFRNNQSKQIDSDSQRDYSISSISQQQYAQSAHQTLSDDTAFNHLLQTLLQQESSQDHMKQMILYYQNSRNDANTTITQSFVDQLQLKQELISSNQSLKSSKANIYQRNKKIKKIFLFLIGIILLIAIGATIYICLRIFNKNITCQEEQYLSESNRCLNCDSGCLRCSGNGPQTCYSCIGDMYLVLNSQNDKLGDCLTECTGRKLYKNQCLRQY